MMAQAQQQTINLYQGAVPNSKPTKLVDQTSLEQGMFRRVANPQLEVYAPEAGKANGAAVIIIPGGSYKVVVYQSEGIRSAQEFAKNGITAFVLKYRLPADSSMVDKTIGPLQDAQQAMSSGFDNVYHPRPEIVEIYEILYQKYLQSGEFLEFSFLNKKSALLSHHS